MEKALIVITNDDVGGVQKYVKDLQENLDKQKFEVKILTGGQGGVRFLSNALQPHFLFFNDLAAVVELFLIFRRERPDIIHLNSSKAGVIGAIAAQIYNWSKVKGKRSRVVFTAHGWVFNPDNNLGGFRRRFYIWMHKIAALFQDSIINVSEYDRNLALKERIAPAEKLVTVRNGVDYKNIIFLDKLAARKFLSSRIPALATDDGAWIGSIGRLVGEKNYLDLVRTANIIQRPNTKFFIIGEGSELKKLKLMIGDLGLKERFFILEGIAPAVSYLKAFDIFVLPSIKEGLPYTVLEAMAAELPIVVTRVGGMTEIIEGQASPGVAGRPRGLVMPPREPAELARAIEYYLDNPDKAKESAKTAHEFLKQNLTLEKMVTETEKIYLANRR